MQTLSEEDQKLADLAQELIDATDEQILGGEGVESFIQMCEVTRENLRSGRYFHKRMTLAVQVGLKAAHLRENPPKLKPKPAAGFIEIDEAKNVPPEIFKEVPRSWQCPACREWIQILPTTPATFSCPWCNRQYTQEILSGGGERTAGNTPGEADKPKQGARVTGRDDPPQLNPMGALPVPKDPDDEPW